MRIVSLVPAATEIVCALGLRESLVGRSHECDFPPDVVELPAVTRSRVDASQSSAAIDGDVRRLAAATEALYDVDADLLAELHPDLVITQGACDVCAVPESQAREVAADVVPDATVLSLSPVRLGDVAADIERVAAAGGVADEGAALVARLAGRINAAGVPVPSPPRVAVLEWLDPPILAGHWTPDVVAAAGCIVAGPPPGSGSTTATWEGVAALRVDALVVAPCGFDLDRTRQEAADRRERLWAAAPRVLLVDGNAYLNRPGPRLADAAEGVAAWLWGRPLPPGFEPLDA
ncbi:MAG: ABC transporter substrate-binding protein [Acidimicrobiales bacterium]